MSEDRAPYETNLPEDTLLAILKEADGVDTVFLAGLAKRVEAEAHAITITSEPEKGVATERLAATRKAKIALEVERKSRVDPLNAQVAKINQAFGTLALPIKRADETIEQKIIQWDREQTRLRGEAIRRQAEAERERERQAALAQRALEFKAHAERQIQETKKVVTEAQTLGEFLEAQDEAERIQADVVPAVEAADRVLAQPIPVVVDQVEPPPAPVKTTLLESGGTSTTRQNWQWAVETLDDVPSEFKMLDSAKVTRLVKAGLRKIPGIRIWDQGGISISAKA